MFKTQLFLAYWQNHCTWSLFTIGRNQFHTYSGWNQWEKKTCINIISIIHVIVKIICIVIIDFLSIFIITRITFPYWFNYYHPYHFARTLVWSLSCLVTHSFLPSLIFFSKWSQAITLNSKSGTVIVYKPISKLAIWRDPQMYAYVLIQHILSIIY